MELTPSSAGDITLEKLQQAYAKLPWSPNKPTYDMVLTPWPWDSLGVGLSKEIADSQRTLNGVLNAQVEIISSPYMPKTRRVQFRFPRSKKKRIRNKWAKQSRNFRYESVVWMVDKSKLMNIEYPKPIPLKLSYDL